MLRNEGADILGFNCHSGPQGIMSVMEQLDGPLSVPLSVYPNAGLADYVDGHYVYGASPEYFGECAKSFVDLGTRLLGGCCGTTPDHIAAISKALNRLQPPPLASKLCRKSLFKWRSRLQMKGNEEMADIPASPTLWIWLRNDIRSL